MSQEYNSKLIDRLYQETNPEKATHIADDMVEIGDAIFVYPILSAYKKFRDKHYGHYFISDLVALKNNEATEVLKELCVDDSIGESELHYLIEFCVNTSYFLESFSKMAEDSFIKNFTDNDIDEYDLETYLNYFIFTKRFENFENEVMTLFSDTEDDKDLSTVALKYLLKYNATKYLQYYYENYNLIKNKSAEIVFAKEILGWSNGILPEIRKKILTEGSERAREIVSEKIKKEEEKKEDLKIEIEKKTEYKFKNIDIINEIISTREKVNMLSIEQIGFPIFNSAELIIKQSTPAETEKELIGYCTYLREVIANINGKVSEHGYNEEAAKEIIPGLTFNGSINNLHLYLVSKGYNVNINFFGFRKLNKIVSKLVHSGDDKSSLLEVLKETGLTSLYTNEMWQDLHKKILEMYQESLILFLTEFSAKSSK